MEGGNVNYYLIDVKDPKRLEPYTAEVEDLIETLNMNFAEGTLLKSLVRLCKLRQAAGKAGSTELYEAQKINYYGERILCQAKRNAKNSDTAIPERFSCEHVLAQCDTNG